MVQTQTSNSELPTGALLDVWSSDEAKILTQHLREFGGVYERATYFPV